MGCVISSCLSTTVPTFSITRSASSITVCCIHNSPTTTPVPTQASVIVVEGRVSPIHLYWTSGGERANCIPNINKVVSVLLHICFDNSKVQDYFQLFNDDPLFIFLATLLQRSWVPTSLSSKILCFVNGDIPGNDSLNFVTQYFAACGVGVALPVLGYTLWNTISHRAPNVLTVDNKNSMTVDICSASFLPLSSVWFAYTLWGRVVLLSLSLSPFGNVVSAFYWFIICFGCRNLSSKLKWKFELSKFHIFKVASIACLIRPFPFSCSISYAPQGAWVLS